MLFLINAALLTLAFWGVGRIAKGERLGLVRIALLAVVVGLDAAFILLKSCHLGTLGYLAIVVMGASATLPGGLTQRFSDRLSGVQLPVYLLSVLLVSALVHIHLPVGTFLTSPGEIGLHIEFLLTDNAAKTMMIVYLAACIYAFAISPRMRSVLCLLALATAMIALVYAYLLPFGYPMMSGLTFEQLPITNGDLAKRALLDVGLVFVVTFLVCAAVLRVRRGTLVAVLVAANVSLAITTAITVSQADDSGIGGAGGSSAIEKPLQFSKTEPNVMIIMLDRFMGGFMEPILEYDKDVNQRLSGFTWYPKTLAAGENSIAGVHPVFGGYDYTPTAMNKRGGVLRDMSTEAFRILPENFSKKGYVSNVVNPRGLGFTMAGDCSYLKGIDKLRCSHTPATLGKEMAKRHGIEISTDTLSRANYSELLVLLGTMRAATYWLKHVLNTKGPWRPFLDHSAGTTLQQWAELKALPELTGVDSKEKNLNLFWNLLPHEPYFMGLDCRPRQQRLQMSKESMRKRGATSLFEVQHAVAARCALLLVADYLDWMKKQGVYDNTTIVIVSDHGIVGEVRDRSSMARAGKTTGSLFVRSRSVLLVKERQASGPLKVSQEFVPNAEVPRIVCEDIGGCINPYLDNKPIEADGRDDPFYVDFVPWQFSEQERNRFRIRAQLRLTGKDPFKRSNWSELRKTK